jgi:hypothetical protein
MLNNDSLIKVESFIKHLKYKDSYIPNSLYWGLGIENEVYLEFNKKKEYNIKCILLNNKRERYSIDYYTNYKDAKESLNYFINNNTENNILIPLLLNSHSFINTDKNNNSQTLYTIDKEINPCYNNETFLETLQKYDSYFKDTYENEWIFDGDTIEFTTLNFFNNTLDNVIKELYSSQELFLFKLNTYFFNNRDSCSLSKYGPVKIMENNHPFATHLTNFDNITMFNNGTLHYNITLPTELNEKKNIKDMNKFIKQHNKAIKAIQWMEPFIISVYGSPDFLSTLVDNDNSKLYSKASQRCAVSRYISIGTYDSSKMLKGKILSKKIEELELNEMEYWWFNRYYNENGYTKLDEIGMDINFNKHYNHGIELRFLDHIVDNNKLYKSFVFIIYLMDYILENDHINYFENPIYSEIWNNIVLKSIKNGKDTILNNEEIELYQKIFKFNIDNNNIYEIFHEIYYQLLLRFTKKEIINESSYNLVNIGQFSKLTLSTKLINTQKEVPQQEIKEEEKHEKKVEIEVKEEIKVEVKQETNNINIEIFSNNNQDEDDKQLLVCKDCEIKRENSSNKKKLCKICKKKNKFSLFACFRKDNNKKTLSCFSVSSNKKTY